MAFAEPIPEIPEHIMRLLELSESRNIAAQMDDAARGRLGATVLEEYQLDYRSMSDWREKMEKGLAMASLARGEKRQKPFEGSSEVIFPLVTSAALQFNARAYPAIVQASDVVLCKVQGGDPSGQKAARGKRVSEFLSYTILSKIREWETETDALLTVLPIVGTMLRKVWYDESTGRTRVKLCDAGAVIINDRVKSLELAPRISEMMKLYPYEVEERRRAGLFLAVDLTASGDEDRDAPQEFIEQHRRIDLDGDGYPEPYVVTVHKDTQTVVRIVANYSLDDIVDGPEGVVSIARRDHYVVYHFLPSMTGGFWGTGLGLLLGDISESINAIVRQMIDAGMLNNIGGGWIGAKDFRTKGGPMRIKPFEWKQVQAYGDDLRKAIVPLPKVEPSPVLFQMLGLLIEMGREIASVKDVMTGDANRQMTATTTLALIEQGQMVFTAAYKRIYRALGEEFRMIADITGQVTTDEEYSAFHDLVDEQGQPVLIPVESDFGFDDMDIVPVADPRSVTSMQAMGRAQFLMEMAQAGIVDPQEAGQRMLEAASIDDAEALVPKPDEMQMQIQQAQLQHEMFMQNMARGEAEVKIAKMMAEIREIEAGIATDAAETEMEGVRLAIETADQRMARLLEMARDVDKRDADRMAGAPGNAGSPGVSPGGGGIPQGVDPRILLDGFGTGAGNVPADSPFPAGNSYL